LFGDRQGIIYLGVTAMSGMRRIPHTRYETPDIDMHGTIVRQSDQGRLSRR